MAVPVQQAPLHRITPVEVFALAPPVEKLIVIALLVSALAALVVLALKLRDKRLPGGSAFLSGLRLGGPILGGFGACWSLLNMTIGYANAPGDLPLKVLAPGFAEAFLLVALGFLAGVVAVLANWAIESRIDHTVLKA